MQSLTDPDVQILAGLAAAIAPDYGRPDDDPWIGSPFQWILSVPSRTKGAIGESLVAGWAAAKGFDVARSRNSQFDRMINGHRVEIKFSTLWATGIFKFQQIRDQEYDFVLCLGISPFDAQAWLIPKSVLKERVIGRMGQHTGAAGTDTAWLSFLSSEPLQWLQPFGGRLSDCAELIKRASH